MKLVKELETTQQHIPIHDRVLRRGKYTYRDALWSIHVGTWSMLRNRKGKPSQYVYLPKD